MSSFQGLSLILYQAKKPTIPPELLNNANSYEDKVGVVRMVVQNDQSRVASVIRSMIQTQ